MFYEPADRDRDRLPHDPFKALVCPRPIGWISTMDLAGRVNLAPYSFFNAFSSSPPIVGFSSDGKKDSYSFAEESGEFVWNMATYSLRFQMNASSASLERGHSEFNHAKLVTAPSRLVRAPRVRDAPASFECKVVDIIHLRALDGRMADNHLVLGQVIGVHLDERFIKDGRVDTASMRPLARCGYQDYAVADILFAIDRPAGVGKVAVEG